MKTAGTKSKLFGMTCVPLNVMDRTHLLGMADLDQASSVNPLSASDYKRELSKEFMHAYGIVGPDRELVAFAIVRKGGVAATLTDVVVHKGYRRIGVGRMLIDCIRRKCLNETRKFVEAVVSDVNLDAHLFLKKCGFRAIEVLPGTKCDHYLFRATKPKEDCE
jgi:GNAT superfamily N-acetyltransferase